MTYGAAMIEEVKADPEMMRALGLTTCDDCDLLIAEDDAVSCTSHGEFCSERCRDNHMACEPACSEDPDLANDLDADR